MSARATGVAEGPNAASAAKRDGPARLHDLRVFLLAEGLFLHGRVELVAPPQAARLAAAAADAVRNDRPVACAVLDYELPQERVLLGSADGDSTGSPCGQRALAGAGRRGRGARHNRCQAARVQCASSRRRAASHGTLPLRHAGRPGARGGAVAPQVTRGLCATGARRGHGEKAMEVGASAPSAPRGRRAAARAAARVRRRARRARRRTRRRDARGARASFGPELRWCQPRAGPQRAARAARTLDEGARRRHLARRGGAASAGVCGRRGAESVGSRRRGGGRGCPPRRPATRRERTRGGEAGCAAAPGLLNRVTQVRALTEVERGRGNEEEVSDVALRQDFSTLIFL
jgi:hypothetical protein